MSTVDDRKKGCCNMPDGAEPPVTASAEYGVALESLRSAAKWLLTAFAVVAGALAAGLQLTGLGGLEACRLIPAAIGAGIALWSLGYMATKASAVLAQEWVTLGNFSNEELTSLFRDDQKSEKSQRFRTALERIEDDRNELYGHVASSLPNLRQKLRETNEKLISGQAGEEEKRRLAEESAALREAARDVAQCASYFTTLGLFQDMRKTLAWTSFLVVAGLGVFAWAANPPKEDKPLQVQVNVKR
ncbi:hypothetical protein ACWKT3_28695 [Streptomyces violaceus]